MKKLFFVLTLVLASFVTSYGQQSDESTGISFYAHNEAFRDMQIQVTTPSGKVYSSRWNLAGYDAFLNRAEYDPIDFPKTNGRNCKVKIHYTDKNGNVREVNFLLGNFDYRGHDFYVLISTETLQPAMLSNWGPIEEMLPLISCWYYPNDDFIVHPSVVQKTKSAPGEYYKELAAKVAQKRAKAMLR